MEENVVQFMQKQKRVDLKQRVWGDGDGGGNL